ECAPPSRHLQARRHDGGHARRDGGYLEAMTAPPPAHRHHHASPRPAVASAPAEAPVPPAEPVARPPAGWQSSDPRGIIVVPIEAPIPVKADKPH
ncbi:MAG TPA: hypothetical protein VHO06_12420, partial [Polyangia bacterium]|nr:hypothetical protein [Polyangia bacterium]